MDSSFIEKLRMNNIFGGTENGGQQPFGMPNMRPGFDPSAMEWALRNVLPIIREKEMDDRNYAESQRSQDLMRQQRGQLGNIGNNLQQQGQGVQAGTGTEKTPNVKFDNGMDEYQRAMLGLRREELNQKTGIEKGKLAQGEEKVKQGEEKIKQTGEIAKGKQGISQQRTDILKFKSEHPNVQWLHNKGGNAMYYDPVEKRVKDSGIDSGELNDADEIQMKANDRMNEIEARGNIQKDVQGVRGNQRLAEIGAQIEGQKDVNAAKPAKELMPTQIRVQSRNNASELINARPDLGKFVHVDPNGDIAVDQPGVSTFGNAYGPTQEQFDEINRIIYGKNSDIELPSDTKKSTAPVKPGTVSPKIGGAGQTTGKPAGQVNDPMGLRK